jgi:hypothetical protein
MDEIVRAPALRPSQLSEMPAKSRLKLQHVPADCVEFPDEFV